MLREYRRRRPENFPTNNPTLEQHNDHVMGTY
jgi:hypothetical protein